MSKLTPDSSIYLMPAWKGLAKMAEQIDEDFYSVQVEFRTHDGGQPKLEIGLYLSGVGWAKARNGSIDTALKKMKAKILDELDKEVEYKDRVVFSNGT